MRFFLTLLTVILLSIAASGQKTKPNPKQSPKTPTAAKGQKPVAATAQPPSAIKCQQNGFTASEIADITAGQNKIRSEVKLSPLVWDCRLANMAQEWASKGVFAHRQFASDGENLFVSTNPSESTATVVSVWLNERGNWNNSTGMCAPSKVCTHYTQMVWKKTTHVGCGINRNAPGKWKVLVVCNYSPPGNTGDPAF